MENVIFNADNGDIKYIDFGVSCENNCITLEGAGTPIYLPPEMVPEFKKIYDKNRVISLKDKLKYTIFGNSISNRYKQDVWSLGVLIYIMIYKKHPYLSDPFLDIKLYNDIKNEKKLKMQRVDDVIGCSKVEQEFNKKLKPFDEQTEKTMEEIYKLSKDTKIEYSQDIQYEKYNKLLKCMLEVDKNKRKTASELVKLI